MDPHISAEIEYQKQLRQIASKVDSHLANHLGELQTFRARIKPLAKRWKDYQQAVEKRKEVVSGHWKLVKKNPKLQDKDEESFEKKGWEWDRFYGCWSPKLEPVPEDPQERLKPTEEDYRNNNKPRELLTLPRLTSKSEKWERYYIFLSSVHDNCLPEFEQITEGIWPEDLANAVWTYCELCFGDKTAFLTSALERIQQGKAGRGDTQPDVPYTRGVGQNIWVKVLGVSRSKVQRFIYDKSPDRTYHFKQISPRKWALPIDEVPADAFEKYKMDFNPPADKNA